MERHIIADDVEIEHVESGFGFELPTQAVKALDLDCPKSGRFIRSSKRELSTLSKIPYIMW